MASGGLCGRHGDRTFPIGWISRRGEGLHLAWFRATVPQAERWMNCEEKHMRLDAVIELRATRCAVQRCRTRVRRCGRVARKWYRRHPGVLTKRLASYRTLTEPLITTIRSGASCKVDGMMTIGTRHAGDTVSLPRSAPWSQGNPKNGRGKRIARAPDGANPALWPEKREICWKGIGAVRRSQGFPEGQEIGSQRSKKKSSRGRARVPGPRRPRTRKTARKVTKSEPNPRHDRKWVPVFPRDKREAFAGDHAQTKR